MAHGGMKLVETKKIYWQLSEKMVDRFSFPDFNDLLRKNNTNKF
jgi:hypothetical protein